MIEALADRHIRAAFLEPLIEPILKPLEENLGEFGALVTAACARAIADHAV